MHIVEIFVFITSVFESIEAFEVKEQYRAINLNQEIKQRSTVVISNGLFNIVCMQMAFCSNVI